MKIFASKSGVWAVTAVLGIGLSALALDAWGGRGGGGRGGGGAARTSVHRGANVNHHANINRSADVNVNRTAHVNVNRTANVNVDRNVNVNRYNNVHVDHRWNHPVGTAVAIGATAAVVGSILYSLPPSCSTVSVGGVTYQQCGSTWYQPRYSGTSVQYVVVNSPY
jgi:hypothetical protein